MSWMKHRANQKQYGNFNNIGAYTRTTAQQQRELDQNMTTVQVTMPGETYNEDVNYAIPRSRVQLNQQSNMLHNNAPWLPPPQSQPQQQSQPPPQQPMATHAPPQPQQQPSHPLQQPQLYANQMYQQPQQQPQYWSEEQVHHHHLQQQQQHQQQHQQPLPPVQQQQAMNYNYFVAPQPGVPPPNQQQPLQQTAPSQQLFYQPQPQPQLQPGPPVLDSFEHNNGNNDGWGDWGDWNESANNNNSNNKNNSNIQNESLGEHVPNTAAVNIMEDAFNVQGQSSWQAFGTASTAAAVTTPTSTTTSNNNNNSISVEQHQLPLELGQEPELDAIVPPQAFQNQPVSVAPPKAVPESVSAIGAPPIVGGAGGNPFKRATGPSKRASILATTAPPPPLPISTNDAIFPEPLQQVENSSSLLSPPPVSVAAPAPAPGPPAGVNFNQLMIPPSATVAVVDPSDVPKPFNNAFGNYENQEVLAAPNDERAQYLQTSHLSEQLADAADVGEDNWEADDDDDQLLPPPGLSRLVLGQPELEQQRLVTGTEQPTAIQAVHLPERQADGEDTSDGEQLASRSPPQRVVTGVETIPSLPLQREQREVVMDGENLEDQEASVPVVAPSLPAVSQPLPTVSAISVEQSSEEVPLVAPPPPMISHQPQMTRGEKKQRNQQPSHQVHQAQPMRPKPRSGHSMELDTEDESDELLLSERERDRVGATADHRRDLPNEEQQKRRPGRRSGNHYNTYDGETEDSVRGGNAAGSGHGGESKSSRDRERRGNEQQRSRRGLDPDQDRERERNWRRRSQKYHSGGEDQERYEHSNSRRGYFNNSYDGESDAPDLADLNADNNVGGGGSSSSKPSRNQRRSGGVAPADDDYDDYAHQRGHYRRSGQKSHEKSRSGRRSYEQRERRLDDSTLERERDRRRRHHPDQRHWDGYEEYRRKSSRNSDLEKERTNGGGAVGGSSTAGGSGSTKRRSNNNNNTSSGSYDPYQAPSAYDPYGMYEQMSRNPNAYADMYAKFYGQMIKMTAAANAAAVAQSHQQPHPHGLDVSATQQLAAAAAVAQAHAAASAGAGAGASGGTPGSDAAMLRERERYTHAYINQANEFHRLHQRHHLHHQQQQQQQHYNNYADLLNTSLIDDNSSLYGTESQYSSRRLITPIYGNASGIGISSARSLSNLSSGGGDAIIGRSSSRCGGGPLYAGPYASSECNLDIRAGIATDAVASIPGYASTTTPTPLQAMEVARPPRRRTPLQFNRPHLVASYAMSLLLKVKPKYAGRGRLRNDVEVAAPRIKDGTSSLLRSYPGPLQGRKLHKDKIISFCKEQIRLGPTRQCTVLYATQKKPQGHVDKYRASHALMWNLLILLLRQNGYIADTDVGDLLLENQHEYPYSPTEADPELETEVEVEGEAQSQRTEASDGVDASDAAAQQNPEVPQDDDIQTGAINTNQSSSEQAAIDKFRSYVLRGNVEEALQWATDNNLWTHAFFLALYEDRYALTDVAQKFLNRAIKANDPLQTLYQMKSCHTPACVSQLRDEHWGDWRSHLSILVTNKSRQPEYDRSSVVALGDTLFQRGDIYAAHFCYLVAQEEFGRYDSTATEQTTLTANVPKLILLGASHYKHFNEFASNEAIIMTEIYEYARSLFDQKFSIANFQHYKFLLATRILDYGQHFRCTNYLEQIARHIEIKPESYDTDFIQRVYNLAERLRYHDPILINRVFFASPPNAGNGNNSKDTASEEKTWLRQLRALADTHPQQQEEQLQQQQQQQQPTDIDQQFVEVNNQFRQLNMQYDGSNIEDTLQLAKDAAQTEPQQQPPVHQEYYEQPHQEQETLMVPYAQQQQQQPSEQQQIAPPLFYDPNAVQHQQHQLPTATYGQIEPAAEAYGGQHEQHQQHQQQQQPQDPNAAIYGQTAATTGGYDYWAGTQQPPYGDELQHQQVRPAISMPKSKSYDDEDSGAANADRTQGQGGAVAANDGKSAAAAGKSGGGAGGRDLGAPGNQNAGWFGGIWNKLSLKPKNQMILPDDKNPTIVWDKERKCWLNTEGNADEAESFKPPPKMSDLGMPAVAGAIPAAPLGSQAPTNIPASNLLPHESLQQSQLYSGNPMEYAAPAIVQPAAAISPIQPDGYAAAPSPAVSPAPAPSANAVPGGAQPKLTSNIFKMQRNRTLKNSYVDVFNPSGAPMSAAPENVLAPVIAPAAVPQGGYFVPGQQQQHYQQQQ